MAKSAWRRFRWLFRAAKTPSRRPSRIPIRSASRHGGPGGDVLIDALLRLRKSVDDRRLDDLALAWFRVDEAKASAVWYDTSKDPAYPAVLPEEEALADRVYRQLTGQAPTPANLLRDSGDRRDLDMVRYRLLVSRLPMWCLGGGRRGADAVRLAYQLMSRASDVLSPYGRWLLARAVCLAAQDAEELARQSERVRQMTSDHRSADGASMAFISGGEFDLPLPVAVSEILDWRGMPTKIEALKKDGPPEIQRFFIQLTPHGRQVFLKAFQRRAESYRNGTPWRKPPWLASEGHVFVRTTVSVPPFYIDRRPVSHQQFLDFAHRHKQWLPSRVSPFAVDRDTYLPTWHGDIAPRDALPDPVTGVSYQTCRAYVAAHEKQLPSEAQWLAALIGEDVPETRYLGGEGRPTMSDEERAIYGRRAAERGLHIMLPERLADPDGAARFTAADGGKLLFDPRGQGIGGSHIWRTPTARGRLPDLAGDANLTFRGALPASRVWAKAFDRSQD